MHTFPLEWYLSLIERDDWAGVAALMSRSAGKLIQAGAELIICPNNTLHRAFDHVVSAVPWLHIVEAVTAEIRRIGLRRVGLLGTAAVMEGRIYDPQLTQAGIEVVLPEEHERSRLHHIIGTELIRGQYTSPSHPGLHRTSTVACRRAVGSSLAGFNAPARHSGLAALRADCHIPIGAGEESFLSSCFSLTIR
jgi:aspartate/glutamate racemase